MPHGTKALQACLLATQKSCFDLARTNPTLTIGPLKSVKQYFSLEGRASIECLPGYAYYDHFLRFIHVIGPENAARIKNLNFSGTVIRHRCNEKQRAGKANYDDLLKSMRFYIPFIIEFCKDLEKLVINAAEDTTHEDTWTIEPTTHEDAILGFLENDLRNIPTLKVLEVPGSSFAEPAIAWFKERAARRMREATEECEKKKLTDLAASLKAHGRYCGEGHIWAECHNLCNFCGGFGHFRKDCQKFSS